jgi:hypothetical protein
VRSEAGSGDVLVSGTVRDILLGSGIELVDRGVHEIKGVPGDWRLFAVATERAEAPISSPSRRLSPLIDPA